MNNNTVANAKPMSAVIIGNAFQTHFNDAQDGGTVLHRK